MCTRENTATPQGFLGTVIVVECKKCGKSYDEAAWFDLELVGYQANVADDAILELRNCECGSSHAVECDVNDLEGRSILVDAIEALLVAGRKITIAREAEGKIVIGAETATRVEAYVAGSGGLSQLLLALVDALPPPRVRGEGEF